MNWLQKEARGKEIFYLMIGCVCFNLTYCIFATLVINLFQIKVETVTQGEQTIKHLTSYFPVILILLAAIEEVFFRLPLALFVALKSSITAIMIFALISSVIFGFLHGDVSNIFTQGVIGFSFCIMFLKCGGLQGRYFKAFMVTTATHALFNMVLCFLVLTT